MSKEKFTPGPWTATRSDPNEGADVWWITGTVAKMSGNAETDVATVCGGKMDGKSEANANLIAACPELYEALDKLMKRYMDLVSSGDCGFWDPAKEPETIAAGDALAKARGENHD
jgi:hypothetical protein